MTSERSAAKVDRVWLRTADDDALLERVRGGDGAALSALYGRHRRDALRYASRLTRRRLGHDVSDDVVAEALRKVLTALSGGRGPRTGFRAYLFTAIRTVTVAEALDQLDPIADGGVPDPGVPGPDDLVDSQVAMRAFDRLPERWRQVLWATKVDGLTPTDAAFGLGMRPNSVAALAMRAREALRIAYVREHLPLSRDRSCSTALDLLARRSVVSIGPSRNASLAIHLETCAACEDAVELLEAQIGSWIRSATSMTEIFHHHTLSSEALPDRSPAATVSGVGDQQLRRTALG